MEKSNKVPSSFVIGLALFSMFFGSGNLIFPLYMGQLAQEQWMYAAIGFILTGVLVPFLGIVAMTVYKGDYGSFFNFFGKKIGFLLALTLLTVWVPLGSSPRCITLAYASLSHHLPLPPLWMFSIGYCFCVAMVVMRRSRMLDILGYFLTPLLLFCIALLVIFGYRAFSGEYAPSAFSDGEILYNGLKEGYNTMDLIASFFFSASVIEILRQSLKSESSSVKKTFKSCIVGMGLLGIVYSALISLAAMYAPQLQGIPKDQLLVFIAKMVLGEHLGFVAAVAIGLACFTTSIALVIVYADFISEKIFKDASAGKRSIFLTLVLSFGMSIFGLHGITKLTGPILQVFYPLLIILIFLNLGKISIQKFLRERSIKEPA